MYQPTSSGVKKLMQVSEEYQNPVHIPVVLAGECYVITQQDMRKIEDVRLLLYHKLGPNGEVIQVEGLPGQGNALGDAILNAAQFCNQSNSDVRFQQLMQLIQRNCCVNRAPPAPTPTKASIAQQMEWENIPNSTSPAFPFTYNKTTSVNDIPRIKCYDAQSCKCHCAPRVVLNESCNTTDESSTDTDPLTSAKQKLKLRKMLQEVIEI